MAFKNGSQNDLLMKHFLSGRSITRIEADHMYRIAALTRRIRDLREAGHNIVSFVKRDPHGNPYTEYSLVMRTNYGTKKKAA